MSNQVLASDVILRMNNYPLLGFVQSNEFQVSLNPDEIFELGRVSKVDTAYEQATTGNFEVLSTGHTAGILARMIPVRTAGAFDGYMYDDVSSKNAYTVQEADLTESQFDLVAYMKPDQKTFTRVLWFPRCYLTTIAGRADANGNATETYSWAGNYVAGWETPYHDIVAVPCTVTDSTTLAQVGTPVTSTTHTLIYVYVNDKKFRNSTTSDASKFAVDNAGVLTLTTSEGYTIPADAVCRAVFYKTATPSTTFPSIQSSDRPTSAFYVKGYQVDLFLAPADASSPVAAESWLRAQTADWNIDLRSEDLRQLAYNSAGTSVYCRAPQLPFAVTVNASVLAGPWDAWKAMMNKSGSDVYAKAFDYDPADLKGSPSAPLALVVHYKTKAGVVLQKTTFSDLALDQPSQRVQVQGRLEEQFSFKGTTFKVQGFDV